MDPVAHTLIGAALAETGLKRRSRHATATLLIGANLPDIDALAGFWGNDVSLLLRRGWTHGVLAMVVLPLLLAAAVWLWQRWRGTDDSAPQWRPRWIIALAFLAVWSHPLLDWLNTYGVRLLMPFDARWFYGDTLFIIDPWVWLLAAAGVVLARSASRGAAFGWLVLAALASVAVLGTEVASSAVKLAWIVALALLVALRWRGLPSARVAFAALLLYIGVSFGLGRWAEMDVRGRFPGAQQVQSNPVLGEPFAHRVVVVEADVYRIVAENGAVHTLPRQPPDAAVKAALAHESVREFANWMRFPHWKVDEAPDHWRVQLLDLRYQGPDLLQPRGIGRAVVEVPKP